MGCHLRRHELGRFGKRQLEGLEQRFAAHQWRSHRVRTLYRDEPVLFEHNVCRKPPPLIDVLKVIAKSAQGIAQQAFLPSGKEIVYELGEEAAAAALWHLFDASERV